MKTGTIWPIHLKPEDDELLSSWMIRLAHAHGLKVMTLCTLLFGYRRPIWNRDIDRLAPKDVLDKLSQITGASPDRVYATTIRELEGKAFEKFNLTGNTHWLLPLGIRSRSHKDYGLQYCHQCLLEDSIPYFRRSWRLGFITVCTKHKTILSDCCNACGTPVMPHRVDMRSRTEYPTERDMLICSNCGASIVAGGRNTPADDSVVQYQQRWEEALKNGWISWAGNPSMYSHIFFEGLRVMCSGLVARKERERLRDGLEDLRSIADGITKKGVEYARLNTRYKLIKHVIRLLDDWPEKYTEVVFGSRIRYSTLRGYKKIIPYWYQNVIRKWYLRKSTPLVSNSESENIRHTNKCCGRNLVLLGDEAELCREMLPRIKIHNIFRFTHDEYEAVIASIDHEISGTRCVSLRNELLQDKFMFAIAFALKLSIRKLSLLTIGDVRSMVDVDVQPEFYQGPRSLEQGRAWCEWYFKRLRPNFNPRENEERLFISAETAHGMNRKSISYRLRCAISVANLDSV